MNGSRGRCSVSGTCSRAIRVMGTGEGPRASPQSNGNEEAGPLVVIARRPWNGIEFKDSREMKCDDPNPKHQTDTGGRPAWHEIEGDAQTGGDEGGAEEGDPEHVP